MKKKKWVVTSVLTMPIIAMISCETPNEIQNDLDLELPPLPQPVLRPEEPSKPEKPKSTTPNEPSPTTPPTTPKSEEPKKIDPIKTQPSDDKPILDESKKTKDPSDSLNEQESNPKPTIPSDKPEEPKIEGNFPNQPNNKANSGETSLPQKKDSEQGSQESREKLKQVLESIPTALVIAKNKINQFKNPISILYNFKNNVPKDWNYVNFVNPIPNITEDGYKVTFDFSSATHSNDKIENVKLKLTDLNNNIETKNVSLTLSTESANLINSQLTIVQKTLPENFSGIFPSFLAYALTHSEKNIDDSIFSESDKVIGGLSFGIGLVDSFVEIKNNNHHKIHTISAIPNDDEGTLNLTVEARDQSDNFSNTAEDSKQYTFKFTGLAKNSDNLIEFKVDDTQLRSEIKNNSDLMSKIKTQSRQGISLKNSLNKLIKKHLQIFVKSNQNITNYKMGLFNVEKELKGTNHILFPQIIFFELFNNRYNNYSDDKIKFDFDNSNKINYTWNLDYQYLDFNQSITENNDLIPGSHHTKKLTGTIDLN